MARTSSILTSAEVAAVGYLAALGNSIAVVTNSSGKVVSSATTATQIGYLSGTTGTTGTGNLVLSTSPTLITPTLGVATATSINKVTITAPATSATLTIANGKTLTANASLTFTGTDSTTMTFPSTSATIARTDAGNTFTGNQVITGTTALQDTVTITSTKKIVSSASTYNSLDLNDASGNVFLASRGSVYLDIDSDDNSTANVLWVRFNAANVTPTVTGIFQENGSFTLGSTATTGTGAFYAGTISSASTLTVGAQASASSVGIEIGNYSGGIGFIDFKTSNIDYDTRIINNATSTLGIVAASGEAIIDLVGRYQSTSTATTQHALSITASSLTTGSALKVYSNSTSASARNLVDIRNNSTSATTTTLLYMNQKANYLSQYIVHEGTTIGAVYIGADNLTTGALFSLYSQSTDTSTRPLLWIRQNSSAATGTTGIQIDHISSGYAMKISQSVNNANACYGLQMNITNSGAGASYAFRFDGAEIVTAAVGGSQSKKVKISIAGTVFYIPCYTA